MAQFKIIAPDRPPPLIKRKFRMPFDSAQVAWDWKTRGFSCAIFTDPPGREWNGFLHDSDQLVTVFEGRLELEIEGRRLILEQGDEAFIPCGARHSVRNISERTTRWFYGYGDIASAETAPQISETHKPGHEFRY